MASPAMAITIMAITMQYPATATIMARRRPTVTTARLRRGSKTTLNAAAQARVSAPAAAWESARSAERICGTQRPRTYLKRKPGHFRPGFCAVVRGPFQSWDPAMLGPIFPHHCPLAGRVRVVNVTIRMANAVAIHARFLRRIGGVAGPDAEHAIDTADDATDRTADDRSDGSGRVVAHIGAMGDAVGNTLRLRRERRNERCGDGDGGCEHNLELHAEILS